MTREEIIAAIDEEITRLEKVRVLLNGAGSSKILVAAAVPGTRKKRNLSADARKRIADAQKRRWAKQKKQSASSSAK
jgi:fructoselysine-6-P-deglycase FrlB-like protein